MAKRSNIADKLRITENRRIEYEWRNQPQDVMIGGRRCKFKSKQEMKWALYLELLKELGAVIDWQYEPKRFEFKERWRTRHVYTPDFRVEELVDGKIIQVVWHEIKTSLRQRDVLRFKLMAMDYPDEIMVLVLNSGSKKIRQIELKANAMRYIERIVYAAPIFRKFGIR